MTQLAQTRFCSFRAMIPSSQTPAQSLLLLYERALTSHATCVQMTVDAVKYKLSSHCGTPATDMLLQLRNNNGTLISILTDSQRKLGFYSPQDG